MNGINKRDPHRLGKVKRNQIPDGTRVDPESKLVGEKMKHFRSNSPDFFAEILVKQSEIFLKCKFPHLAILINI